MSNKEETVWADPQELAVWRVSEHPFPHDGGFTLGDKPTTGLEALKAYRQFFDLDGGVRLYLAKDETRN